ncbi:hypothetical protein JCM10914A_02470 [Paenibacillus sp. JCM 10914]|nr:hypothetical protein [Paenibacillus sp. JCM 10914]
MRTFLKRSLKLSLWLLAIGTIAVFALLFLFQIIFIAGLWYKDHFM